MQRDDMRELYHIIDAAGAIALASCAAPTMDCEEDVLKTFRSSSRTQSA